MIKLLTLVLILVSWGLLAQSDSMEPDYGDQSNDYANERNTTEAIEPAVTEGSSNLPPAQDLEEGQERRDYEEDRYREREQDQIRENYETPAQPEPYSPNESESYEEREVYEDEDSSQDY